MEDRVTWWRGDMRTGGRVIGFAARRYLKLGSGAQSADLISGGDVGVTVHEIGHVSTALPDSVVERVSARCCLGVARSFRHEGGR